MLHRLWARDRPRSASGRPQRGGDCATGRGGAGLRQRVRRPRRCRRARRDRRRPDRGGGRGRARRPSAESTCWSTTPVTATCPRLRRARTPRSKVVRCQLLRFGRHDQGGAAFDAGPRFGHIVNISSMTGLVANPPNAYYSSTKFALEAVTEALATEVRPLGIKVTAVEPGAFRTDWATRSMKESASRSPTTPTCGAQGPDQAVRRPSAG